MGCGNIDSCNIPTNLKFSSLEPDFSVLWNQVLEYNHGRPDCVEDDAESWFRFPCITYLRQTTDESQYIDDLHMEVYSEDRQWHQYDFRCHVTVEPRMQELSRFGLDESRNLIAYISLPVLELNNLVYQKPKTRYVGPEIVTPDESDLDHGDLVFLCHPGDRIWFSHELYHVLSVHEDQYFGNTTIPWYLVITCNKYRPDTVSVDK